MQATPALVWSARMIDDVDSFARQDGAVYEFYAWLKAFDGRDVLWHLDLRRPPGQMQTWTVIDSD